MLTQNEQKQGPRQGIEGRTPLIVFRRALLPPSETFVLHQGEDLKSYQAYYVGLRRVEGIDLPYDRTYVIKKNESIISRLKVRAFQRWGFVGSLVRQIKVIQPALIHAHFGVDAGLVLPILKYCHLPLVVTYHGYDCTVRDEVRARSSFDQYMYIKRREELKGRANRFIAVSNFIRNVLVSQGFPEAKVIVHYIGIDVDFFTADVTLPRERSILFVGRLVEKKGCLDVVKAVSHLGSGNVMLMVIGHGPLREAMEREAKVLGVRAVFLGYQSQDKVREWMNRCRVFCMPSKTANSGDSEGFGLVFAEAQAMGLPVVSYKHGGVPEAVEHGKTGLLADEGNVEELGEYIRIVMDDEQLWQRMSTAGPKRVSMFFNRKRQITLLEDIYDEAIDDFASTNGKDHSPYH